MLIKCPLTHFRNQTVSINHSRCCHILDLELTIFFYRTPSLITNRQGDPDEEEIEGVEAS